MRTLQVVLMLSFLLLAHATHAQERGTVTGRVISSESGSPLLGVSIVVDGTNYGTSTSDDGSYSVRLPSGRYVLRFSAIGFVTRRDSIEVTSGKNTELDVTLETSTTELDEVEVEAEQVRQAGVYTIDPETIQDIPTPVRDALRALKVLPGVVTNSELSNQYSVRGGGFNENLIFVNGFEIFLPFRPRNGEQEGMSLLNGDLAQRLTFYSGGFPARYGGKLSSAVDVEYRNPMATGEQLNGTAYASLLDVGVSAASSLLSGRAGFLLSVRKARQRHFFEKQELKGNYQPDYTDVQGLFTLELTPGNTIEVLAMIADHSYRLDPSTRKTFFGTLQQTSGSSNLQSLWIQFDDASSESDGYATHFGGFRLKNRLSQALRLEHDVSIFNTEETEQFDLAGSAILFLADPNAQDPQGGEGLIPIGNSRQEDFADNRVHVTTLTGQGRLLLTSRRHAAETGWSVRRLKFDDHLSEKSVVVGRSLEGNIVRIVADSLQDAARLSAWQAAFYVQDAVDVMENEPGKFLLTGGLRADYFSFTGEWTVSPRLTATYKRDDVTTLFGSVGIYYQAPSYRELRGKPEVGETILGSLNRNLKSQRSLQVVGGVEYFLEQQRYYMRGELFYKRIEDVITYDIENVRVLYSGENDATSKTYGLDLQLRGEFVPGMESWVNYSFLIANETYKESFVTRYNDGIISRPTDQRHTVSLFVQDYITNDPTWRLHMRTLFGSGLPYTPPVPGTQVGNLVVQAPGPRFSARFPRYFRFDFGASKTIEATRPDAERPIFIELTAEMLNVFDMTNEVAYTWVPNVEGIWTRIPTRLTPRTINVRARVRF